MYLLIIADLSLRIESLPVNLYQRSEERHSKCSGKSLLSLTTTTQEPATACTRQMPTVLLARARVDQGKYSVPFLLCNHPSLHSTSMVRTWLNSITSFCSRPFHCMSEIHGETFSLNFNYLPRSQWRSAKFWTQMSDRSLNTKIAVELYALMELHLASDPSDTTRIWDQACGKYRITTYK